MAASLVDENVPRSAVQALVGAGHDALLVTAVEPGAGDERVLEIARNCGRTLLTYDADFRDLVDQRALPAPPAIVRVRLHPAAGSEAGARIVEALREPPANDFTVVARDSIRRRRLPSAPKSTDQSEADGRG